MFGDEGAGGTPPAGQPPVTPPAGTPPVTTPVTTPPTPTPPAGTPAGNQPPTTPPTAGEDPNEQISLEKARELRRENAVLREAAKAGKAAEAKLAEIERERMTELERAKTDAAKAQADAAKMREGLGTMALDAAARKLGFTDPSDAYQLAARLEYGDDGRPSNAETLVRSLLASKPHYANAGNIGGSPTNPNRNNGAAGASGTFTTSQLADFDFYMKNEAAIKQAMREGKIIKDT